MSIKGIIFDFDGTLFDSMGIWETAGEDYLATLGVAAEKDLSKKLASMSLIQSAKYLKERYSLYLTEKEIIDGVNKTIEEFYFYQALPKEGVLSFLSRLKKKGVKMCIATATDRYEIEAALKRCHMLSYFQEIFTCSEVGHGKDEPHIFEVACEAMAIKKSETAIFEDAFHAAKTAKDAGFFVAGVYDQYEKRTEELKRFVDVYLYNYIEAEKQFLI